VAEAPKVLCLCARDGLRRRVARALIACGAEPVFASDAAAAMQLGVTQKFAVMLLDIGADASVEPEQFEALWRKDASGHAPSVLILSRVRQEQRLIQLLETVDARNLIATHERSQGEAPILDEHELMVTCHKLIRRDLFGIDKYLSFVGARIHEAAITSANDRDVLVERLSAFARSLEVGDELEQRIANITDELVTNAVYNAPRLPDGRPKYAHVDLREKIVLEPHEHGMLQWGCDGRYLAVSVSDRFGSLRGETVASYLSKCFRRGDDQIDTKAGGAGLGLYMAFNSTTQLVVNVQVGQRTEVIALFYIRSESRGFKRSGRSLNVFIDDR
jgi:anti-sigma regulatory factor (Ser/Thr protein kinase)